MSNEHDHDSQRPPAGSAPASCSGARSRAEDETPTGSRHGFAVPETKEGVELRRVIEEWEAEEADYRENAEYWTNLREAKTALYYERAADDLASRIIRLKSALCAEPSPQSERSEDECPTCNGQKRISFVGKPHWSQPCPECSGHETEPSERCLRNAPTLATKPAPAPPDATLNSGAG